MSEVTSQPAPAGGEEPQAQTQPVSAEQEAAAQALSALEGIVDTSGITPQPAPQPEPQPQPTLNPSQGQPAQQQPTEQPGSTTTADGTPPEPVVSDTNPDLLSDNPSQTSQGVTSSEAKPSEDGETPQQQTIKSPMFGDQAVNLKGEKVDPPKIENIETVNAYLKDTFGVDDFGALSSEMSSLREKANGSAEMEAQIANYETVFQNMPAPLYNGIKQFFAGGDWQAEVRTAAAIDYSKPVESFEKAEFINHFHPGKFSQEDWNEYKDAEGDPNIKRAIDLAYDSSVSLFNANKTQIDATQAQMVRDQQNRQAAITQSIDATLGSLKSPISDLPLDEGYKSSLKADLENNAIMKEFYNEDGTYKEDAALKLMMARDGLAVLNQLQTFVQNRAETQERTELLKRTAETPPAQTQTGTVDDVRPEVKKLADDIMKGLNPENTF